MRAPEPLGHQWFCANVSKAANECQEIHVERSSCLHSSPTSSRPGPTTRRRLRARRDAEVRGSFFGVRLTDPEYEECRDRYRAKAKDEAKKIRKAIEWLKLECEFDGRQMEWESRYATYRASW